MKKYLLSLILVGGMFSNAQADCSPDACSNVEVTKLYVTSYGRIYIGTSGDESKLDCISPANVYVTIPNSSEGKEAMYSALLATQTTNKKATIRIVNNSSICEVAYVVIEP
ncbi:hypothetical protein KKC13_09915 [bacterium]|nr:hypothetical protein [bacterium]MBU1956954.1 hypothetical protein [bacterium]